MELAVVAMKPLISKLGQLLLDEYNLAKKVKKGVMSLNNELTMMQAALLKVADIPRDQLDGQVRVWAGKVRELSYEMEDAVDAFMVHIQDSPDADGEAPTIKKKVKKFLKKSTRLVWKGKDLHQISEAFKEAQDLAKELGELRQRYGLLEMQGTSSSSGAIDPRLMAMYKDITELVGVDGTRDELVEMLIGGEDWKKQKLKMVSVVGFGGLGKTTLAKAVYDKIKVQFDCGAFFPVSQSPDIKRVLKDILYELDQKSKETWQILHKSASNNIDKKISHQGIFYFCCIPGPPPRLSPLSIVGSAHAAEPLRLTVRANLRLAAIWSALAHAAGDISLHVSAHAESFLLR